MGLCNWMRRKPRGLWPDTDHVLASLHYAIEQSYGDAIADAVTATRIVRTRLGAANELYRPGDSTLLVNDRARTFLASGGRHGLLHHALPFALGRGANLTHEARWTRKAIDLDLVAGWWRKQHE